MYTQFRSFGSSSATLVDQTPPGPTIEPEDPACWRLGEVESAVRERNLPDLNRIVRYPPFNVEFITARPDLYFLWEMLSPGAEEAKDYVPRHIELKKLLKDIIPSETLDAKLRQLLLEVPFGDWVQKALGLSPTSLERLQMSLFNFNNQVRRATELEKTRVREIAEKMSQEQNPFASIITSAYSLSMKQPKLDFAFIVEPLQEALSSSDTLSDILQKLDILAVRFQRHYSNEFIDWRERYDTATPLLDLLRETDAPAILTTERDLDEFHKLPRLNKCKDLNMYAKPLGIRWNSLCQAVKECAVLPELHKKLVTYARDLGNLRNHYSLSAVVHGLRDTPVCLDLEFSFLVKEEANYKEYRQSIGTKPALPFLFPLIRAASAGDKQAMKDLGSFRRYGKRAGFTLSGLVDYL